MSYPSRHRDVMAARARLAPRFGDEAAQRLAGQYGYEVPAIEAVTGVADALCMAGHDDRVEATPEDVDDALRAVAGARAQLLQDEPALIEAARGNGRSWDDIGTLLGVPVAAAKARPAKIRRAVEDLNRLDSSSLAFR
ncbi:hypothetical protein ACFFV7_41140 [Nonomuraea spiralis]|uniref:Uncharacterized protein n=1 Tax=Nonomuraea spiralis TaxID=46182 RepID=A0ABV5ISW3_9ACTN|nr:hypothetical protein [Nonomuraea spiralis]GGT17181.1 hypothetical protein GCM10010176_072250 [Nonomuraea spiralis]